MKKLFALFILIIISFVIVGCDSSESDFVLTKEMIVKNLPDSNNIINEQRNTITVIEIDYTPIVNDSYFHSAGLLIYKDSMDRIGCFSLLKNGELFPNLVNGSIEIMTVSYWAANAHYVKTINSENQITVYDIFGNKVIETDKYHSISITGSTEDVFNEEGDFDHYDFIETISTVKLSDFELGNTTPVVKTKLLNIEDRTRLDVPEEPKEEYFGGSNDDKIDLEIYGLDGYFGKMFGSYLYVYNGNNQLINTVNIKDAHFGGGTNGKLIYQTAYLADKDSKDYTYINNGNKYLLNSYVVDLITGDVRELKLKYKIEMLMPYKDANGESLYGYAELKDIVSKNLSTMSRNVIVDASGKILTDVGPFALTSLEKLDDNHFYDSQRKMVIDGELKPLYSLENSDSITFLDNITILKSGGKYGAIENNSKIVIPFEYSFISSYKYNGKRVGRHNDNNYYLINEDGSKSLIDSSYNRITEGLLFKYDYDEENQVYVGEIVDYAYTEKVKFEFDSVWNENFNTKLFNIYGLYLINRFRSNDVDKYFLIDISNK